MARTATSKSRSKAATVVPIYPIIEALNLKNADPRYLEAIQLGDAQGTFIEYGITTPLRVAHFLAQILHESGGLSVTRESMWYKVPQLLKIFGEGRHTAALTAAEAKYFAGKPRELANRVYGIGNPAKRDEFNNTGPDDGWLYRGGGLMQTTGQKNYLRYGQRMGTDLVANPDNIMSPRFALYPALFEWADIKGNAKADKDDIRAITKAINGGYNGFPDRQAWFKRVWPMAVAATKQVDPITQTVDATIPAAWEVARPNP